MDEAKFQKCPRIFGETRVAFCRSSHDPEKRARVFLESADGSAISAFDCVEPRREIFSMDRKRTSDMEKATGMGYFF